ncbi:MAG: gluconokinase [Anaerolineae bacterium]|nr:gluconokinase [Anaerolineae bacterium]
MTFLILDVGSSSVRAALFDEQARLIPDGMVRHNYRFSYQPEGAAVIDAARLRSYLESCMDEILQHPQAATIRAVGMATFVGNLVGVDVTGKAITPLYTYADSRSANDVMALRQLVDLAEVHQRTGAILHSAYHPARLHWLARTQPEMFAAVTRWRDFGSYVYGQWFGREIPVSYSVASWSGLLHRESLHWDADWLRVLGVDADAFPALADYSAVEKNLLPSYASRWPALADVPFSLAVGDGAAANVGSGAITPQQIALTVGTTAALRMITTAENPPVPPGLWSYRVDAQHHLIGGATFEGGGVYQWLRETLALPDDLEAQLQQRKAGEHGLVMLPLLNGERSPGWSIGAVGALAGLRQSTSGVDIVQASLEGVALRLAAIADQIGGEAQMVLASGGALENSLSWVQMMANAMNRPLHLLAESETTGRGAALLMLHALDGVPLDAYPPQISRIIAPQPGAYDILQASVQRQRELYTWVTERDWT